MTRLMKLAVLLPLALTMPIAAMAQPNAAATTFVNEGGVRDWQADGEDMLYIQDARGNWFLAKLETPCPELPFARSIGLETKGVANKSGERLDKFGSVVVSGQRYALTSLSPSGPPPAKPR
jgi:hypothetical protein